MLTSEGTSLRCVDPQLLHDISSTPDGAQPTPKGSSTKGDSGDASK